MTSEEHTDHTTWRAMGPVRRTANIIVALLGVVALIVLSVVSDDSSFLAQIAVAAAVITAAHSLVEGWQATTATPHGITVHGVRPREIPWPEVRQVRDVPSALRPDADLKVQAELADGSKVTLPGLKPADVERLRQILGGHALPSTDA